MRELRGKEEKQFFFYSQVMTCDNKLFFRAHEQLLRSMFGTKGYLVQVAQLRTIVHGVNLPPRDW